MEQQQTTTTTEEKKLAINSNFIDIHVEKCYQSSSIGKT